MSSEGEQAPACAKPSVWQSLLAWRARAVVLRTSERYARVSQTEGLAQARPDYVRTPTRTLGCLRRPGAARACVCVNSATSLTSTAPIWLLNPCSSKRQRNAHALPLARPTPKGSASLISRPTSELRGLPGRVRRTSKACAKPSVWQSGAVAKGEQPYSSYGPGRAGEYAHSREARVSQTEGLAQARPVRPSPITCLFTGAAHWR